jgi:hypothetical protein
MCYKPKEKPALDGAHDFHILSGALNIMAPIKRLPYPDLAEYCPLTASLQMYWHIQTL